MKVDLRSGQDFAGECFPFGSEALNASGKAVRGLVKSRDLHVNQEFNSLAGFANERIWRLRRLPAHEFRKARRLISESHIHQSKA